MAEVALPRGVALPTAPPASTVASEPTTAAPAAAAAPSEDGFGSLGALQARSIGQFAELARLCAERKPYRWTLIEPLVAGPLTLTELTMRRPKALELRTSSLRWRGEKTYAELMAFGARLCGHDVAVLDGLDVEDANRLVLATSFFCGIGLPPGMSS